MDTLWLTKLILAHLLTDFVLQPDEWVSERKANHYHSRYLYLHTSLTGLLAWTFIGWQYWLVALIILISHTLIDIWKSYRPDKPKYFLLDQLFHMMVILACWWSTYYDWTDLSINWDSFKENTSLITKITALVFLTLPCAILVGQLTKKWSQQITNSKTLENAGKWIGIIERLIIFFLVLKGQYEAIGLIIAAKGIIRFSDNERTEQKTEYLLIGTMISFSLAIVTGLIVIRLTAP
jgi:hypothetical protein